ncbi:MAG: type II toxin-antitoxin system prevent-host-death family antitoxin [Desulfurellaceae bacterium]|nr:type II toxin-antitoxin system prevent-host-death family antitoxin [Desulfurellaceae bacterium]
MIEVGTFEAKTHLSALLEKVSQGQEVLITKRGEPIARLVPAQRSDRTQVAATIDTLFEFRKGMKLDGLDWQALRDTGRR